MGDNMLPFIITFLAGCSTLIGFFFIYFKNSSNKVLISSLAFASGVMFLISILDLIPSSFSSISEIYYVVPAFLICSLFVVIGIVLSFGVVFVMYYFDTSIKSSDIVEEKLGLTVIGIVPKEERK